MNANERTETAENVPPQAREADTVRTRSSGAERVTGVLLAGLAGAGVLGVATAIVGGVVNGSSAPRVIANATIPGALLAAAVVARRCGSRRRAQIALCCIASIMALFVLSAVLDVVRVDPFERKIRELKAAGREFDERSIRAFVHESRASGSDVLPLLVPRALIVSGEQGYRSEIQIGGREVIPLSFVAHATVTLGNETGRFSVVRLDRHGFNNPDSVWDFSSIDVAAIGDSFTMGAGVDQAENAIARIREVHPSTINLGIAGNSPLFNFATLAEYAAPLKPKTLLWLHYANDLAPYEMTQDEQTPLLVRYLEPGFSQHLDELRPQIEAALRDRVEAELAKPGPATRQEEFRELRGSAWTRARRVLLLTEFRTMLAAAMGEPTNVWTPDLPYYSRVLTEARDRVNSWGGRLVWVCVPDVEEFDARHTSNLAPVFRIRAQLLAMVRSLGIETVDLMPALAAHGDPHNLYSWGRTSAAGLPHLTAEGYAVAASEILKHLPPSAPTAPHDPGDGK